MPEKTLYRAATFMAILVVIAISSWEGYLRHTGARLGYDDDKELWANKRARIYDAPEKTTVFIGSSRIKFDLDIPTPYTDAFATSIPVSWQTMVWNSKIVTRVP